MNLLSNVHCGLNTPSCHTCNQKLYILNGAYQYYHYKCDGFNDVGWGCGYRTLQTMASCILFQGKTGNVPSLRQIQQTLVELGDKEESFIGSREWIGTFEVCLVIDKLFDIPCKILHCPSGENAILNIFPKLEEHFANSLSAPPIMIGGDRDASSKGVLGTCSSNDNYWLLVLDPHFQGGQPSISKIQKEGYVKWVNLKEFDQQSFYNVCLPQFNALCTI